MRTFLKKLVGIVAGLLLTLYSCSTNAEQLGRPFIGVRLDPNPLPTLITRHLQLEPNAGLRIINIQRGGPADKAGLEKDDIIISFQGKTVYEYDAFVEAINEEGPGKEVQLQIIHDGVRKNIKLMLGSFTDNSPEPEWKYPHQPLMSEHSQPGRVFQMPPGGNSWQQVPFDKFPGTNSHTQRFFEQKFIFNHKVNGKGWQITITGDPKSNDARITVEGEGRNYEITADQIAKLPPELQQPVSEALESARESSSSNGFGFDFKSHFNDSEILQDIHQRMQAMNERMDEMYRDFNSQHGQKMDAMKQWFLDRQEKLFRQFGGDDNNNGLILPDDPNLEQDAEETM